MLRNYFRTAVKYLTKHKSLTAINLVGLVTGLTVCFFAIVYIDFESSFDTYHLKANRIYRLVTDVKTPIAVDLKSSSPPMIPAIVETFPEVEQGTRICLDYYLVQTKKVDSEFYEEDIAYADSTLFKVFDFKIIHGDQERALKNPFSVVLSERAARKYFGNEEALNKTLILDGKIEVTVTGIMENMPANSHFKVDMLVSMSTLLDAWNPKMKDNWKRLIFQSYLVLPENYDYKLLVSKFPDFIKSRVNVEDTEYILGLEPLTDVYLHGDPRAHRAGSISTGNVTQLYFFAVVAAFVLFIACFNFVNLSTAFSLRRAKEIGVRKVMGATKSHLRVQFLIDSVFLCLIAFFISMVICTLCLPSLVTLSGKSIDPSIWRHLNHVGIVFLVTIFIGLLSGIYPAMFLSNFDPITVLKGKFVTSSKGVVIRKALTVLQFSISIFLIISTITVSKQLSFIQNKELGFDVNRKLVIDFHFDDNVKQGLEKIKHRLNELGIEQVSVSSCVPGRADHVLSTSLEDAQGTMQNLELDTYFIDSNFLNHYQIQVLEGHGFSEKFTYDSLASDTIESVLINESAAKLLGYSDIQEAIGRRFDQGRSTGRIVGIVRDFHYQSLKERIKPLVLRTGDMWTFMTLDVPVEKAQETIERLEHEWPSLAQGSAFSFFFLDQDQNDLYEGEHRFNSIFNLLCMLAVLISCLGLLALYTYTINQRRKEIGVRKLLGSSVLKIAILLSEDFFYLIIMASVVAAPVAWIAMNSWLNNFAYRIEISLGIIFIAFFVIVIIGLLTISSQIVKAIRENPIKSLRSE